MYDEDGVLIVPALRAGGIAYQSYDANAISTETGLRCTEHEDKAQQQFKEDSDINEIVRRFGLTGQLPENFRAPVSGDFTGVNDFQTAMNAVRAAQEQFDTLPAEVRAEFSNDPQRLMDFLAEEKNRDKAIEMGLVNKPVEKTRDAVMAIDELKDVLTPKT